MHRRLKSATALPNGATFDQRGSHNIVPVNTYRDNVRVIESRPVEAASSVRPVTQGSALGYRMRPRWGQEPNMAIGGMGRAYELFGDKLTGILDELNTRLAA